MKEGVDQAADVVADTAESAQQGIDDASGGRDTASCTAACLNAEPCTVVCSQGMDEPQVMAGPFSAQKWDLVPVLVQSSFRRASTRPARSYSRQPTRHLRWQQTLCSRYAGYLYSQQHVQHSICVAAIMIMLQAVILLTLTSPSL